MQRLISSHLVSSSVQSPPPVRTAGLTPHVRTPSSLGSRLEQWSAATHGFSSMFCFTRSCRLEPVAAHDALKDAIFVFEGGAHCRRPLAP